MRNKYSLLNFDTIEKAVAADTKAMRKVVSHYNRYIGYFAKDNYVFFRRNQSNADESRIKI